MGTTKTRIYALIHKETKAVRLVEAINAAQALRHVVRSQYDVDTPTALEALRIAEKTGAKIEHAATDND